MASDVTACVGAWATAQPREHVSVALRVDVANYVQSQDVQACITLTAVDMVNV